MRVLVLGASGMLGSAAFRGLAATPGIEVFATARAEAVRAHFDSKMQPNLLTQIDVLETDALLEVLGRVRPDIVLNCVGLVKQLGRAKDPLIALPLNSLLPHRLARAAALTGARLVHVSTDCVFRGTIGNYTETMIADTDELYGRSKLLGEVDYPHAITLRTSMIGRELGTRNGLVEWFLGTHSPVRGFTRAIFSGLPTDELVRVIVRHVLPRPDLSGVGMSVDRRLVNMTFYYCYATCIGEIRKLSQMRIWCWIGPSTVRVSVQKRATHRRPGRCSSNPCVLRKDQNERRHLPWQNHSDSRWYGLIRPRRRPPLPARVCRRGSHLFS